MSHQCLLDSIWISLTVRWELLFNFLPKRAHSHALWRVIHVDHFLTARFNLLNAALQHCNHVHCMQFLGGCSTTALTCIGHAGGVNACEMQHVVSFLPRLVITSSWPWHVYSPEQLNAACVNKTERKNPLWLFLKLPVFSYTLNATFYLLFSNYKYFLHSCKNSISLLYLN